MPLGVRKETADAHKLLQPLGWRYHAAALYLVTCHNALYRRAPSLRKKCLSSRPTRGRIARSLSISFTWKQMVKQHSSLTDLDADLWRLLWSLFSAANQRSPWWRWRWKDSADPVKALYSVCIRSEWQNESETREKDQTAHIQRLHKGIKKEPPSTKLLMVPRFAEHTHVPCFALQTFTEQLKSSAALCPD